MNGNKLKAKIIEKGFSVAEFSEAIEMSYYALNRRMNNLENFSIGEAKKIKEVLNLTDEEATEIFFD
ncbi:MAG: helix-turn-helix transcriptional regulator [Oscillospiraceae bacterium]|nr:helix-turn-helix transcriptional regulator [Oscillospiraceae bacterium]